MRTYSFLLLLFAISAIANADESVTPVSAAGVTSSAPAGFVNKVWKVHSSSAVAPGTLYVFLSNATLVITPPTSKPSLGTWKYEGGALTMVEEGIPYKIDVLELTPERFKIRSHNREPGGKNACPDRGRGECVIRDEGKEFGKRHGCSDRLCGV